MLHFINYFLYFIIFNLYLIYNLKKYFKFDYRTSQKNYFLQIKFFKYINFLNIYTKFKDNSNLKSFYFKTDILSIIIASSNKIFLLFF